MMFIARGKVGPFRIDAEVLAGADGMVISTLDPERGTDKCPKRSG